MNKDYNILSDKHVHDKEASCLWATVVRLILLDFASYLIYYTRKKVTYKLLTHEYNYWR